LAALEIVNCPIKNLDGLSGLEKLERLIVSMGESLTSLDGLRSAPDLEESRAGFTELRTLVLKLCPNLNHFEAIKKLPGLWELRVEKCPHFTAEVRSEIARVRPDLPIVVEP
jgi:hypothetical protein